MLKNKPKRRASTKNAYQSALNSAAKRLEQAIHDRAYAIEKLALLNAEIPMLERTVMVLKQQLDPTQSLPPVALSWQPGLQAQTMAPNKLVATLPDFTGMGSIPAYSQPDISAALVDEDDPLPDLPDSI